MRKSLSMGFFLMEPISWSTPNKVLTVHTEWLPGVRLRHSIIIICAVHIYRRLCELVIGCCSWVTEHWRLKPSILGLIPSSCQLFTFFCFLLMYKISFSSKYFCFTLTNTQKVLICDLSQKDILLQLCIDCVSQCMLFVALYCTKPWPWVISLYSTASAHSCHQYWVWW